MSAAWDDLEVNSVLYPDSDDSYFVSYNPGTDVLHGLTELATLLGGKNLVDGEETALVKCVPGERNIYCILSGDFRADYEKIINDGWDACYIFFKIQQPAHRCGWSTRAEDR